ncbi:MAG TPA: hypothetical protein VEA63_02085 [Opitutus sp.]|nr:hypothetical protein [Opitutus sp.]
MLDDYDDDRSRVCSKAADLLGFGPDNNMTGLFEAYTTLVKAGLEATPQAVADQLERMSRSGWRV